MNNLPKYVVSTTLSEVEWNNSTLIKSDVAEEVNKLKHQPGADILVGGGGRLVQSLMSEGLVDEYRVMLYPLVLGTGKRLFTDGGATADLELVDTKTTETGIAILTYRPAARNVS